MNSIMLGLSKEVAVLLGTNTAIVLHKIHSLQPHTYSTHLSITNLSEYFPFTLRSTQRIIQDLVNRGYLTRHARARYSLSTTFYEAFPMYHYVVLEENVINDIV